MIDSLVVPCYFFIFVFLALVLRFWGEQRKSMEIRQIVFLILNIWILGWFLGTWKGLGFYLLLISLVFFGLSRIGLEKKSSFSWCTILVILLVLCLAFVKYIVPQSASGALAAHQIWNTLSLSFITFRLIHVLLDTHAGLIKRLDFLTFYNYVFFVPVSVAGPIQKYNQFAEDLWKPSPLTEASFINSLGRLVLGMAKKIFVAGLLTPYVLGNMEPFGRHPFFILISACLLYSVYIYADFSGYTDIAIGAAGLFGISVPENFNRPYLATNIQDFWNRWHMTLTEWLRTYLFYPVNKFLVQKFPQHARKLDPIIAIMITFAIAGIWHGDSWNFLVFGLMHGVGIAAHFLTRNKTSGGTIGIKAFLSRACTLLYVSIAWIPFVYPLSEIPWLLKLTLH
jgi:D-alanyl-lipoteichoic acid acyltransferase DltB (MBOAT superfamily)